LKESRQELTHDRVIIFLEDGYTGTFAAFRANCRLLGSYSQKKAATFKSRPVEVEIYLLRLLRDFLRA
jgi:hypothetical protein